MKEIKLLHLFPKLLSLYGEYGNVKIIEKCLSDKGYKTVGNYAVKQEMLQKMKTAVPFSIEANKTVRPNIYSRR